MSFEEFVPSWRAKLQLTDFLEEKRPKYINVKFDGNAEAVSLHFGPFRINIATDSIETRSYSSTDRSTASTCSKIFAELLATLSIVDAIRRRRTLSTSSSTLLPISKSNTIVTSSLTIALESRLIVDSSPASIRNGVLRTRPALPLSRNRNDQRSVSLETGRLFPRSSSLPVAQTSLKTISSRLSPMDSSYRLELTIASSPRISCQLSSNSTKLLLLDGLRILSTKSISISKVPRSSQRFVGCFLEFLIGTCFSNGQKSIRRCDEPLVDLPPFSKNRTDLELCTFRRFRRRPVNLALLLLRLSNGYERSNLRASAC